MGDFYAATVRKEMKWFAGKWVEYDVKENEPHLER